MVTLNFGNGRAGDGTPIIRFSIQPGPYTQQQIAGASDIGYKASICSLVKPVA